VFFHDFSAPEDVRAEIETAGLTADEVAPGWWLCRPQPDTPPQKMVSGTNY
jgi:hypothetical protein